MVVCLPGVAVSPSNQAPIILHQVWFMGEGDYIPTVKQSVKQSVKHVLDKNFSLTQAAATRPYLRSASRAGRASQSEIFAQ